MADFSFLVGEKISNLLYNYIYLSSSVFHISFIPLIDAPKAVPEISSDSPDSDASNTNTFRCAVAGNPLPNIKWFRTKRVFVPLKNTSRISISLERNATNGDSMLGGLVTSTLVVRNGSSDDAGSYRCVASNKLGYAVRKFNLTFKIVEAAEGSLTQPTISSISTSLSVAGRVFILCNSSIVSLTL